MPRQKHLVLLAALLTIMLAVPIAAQQPAPVPRGYVLGPGDVLEVVVLGNADLSRTVTVRPDGRISLPLVGSVMAANLTPEQLQDRLVDLLRRYVRDPQVTVIVLQFRRIKVAVLGQVLRPGTYELVPGATVLDAISAAGGLTELAATQARLIRENREVLSIEIPRVLDGSQGGNLPVQDRDTIIIPENFTDVVFLVGEVQKPGAYRLRQPQTLLDVLVQAGGLTQNASLSGARLLRNKTEVVPVNFEALLVRGDISQNIPVQGGDMIFVPEDTESRVYVLGEVARPGVYALKDARTVLRALTQAGGPTAKASLREAYVIRRPPSTVQAGAAAEQVIKVDAHALIRGGDLSKDLPLRAGDVVYVPEGVLTAVGSLLSTILSILTGLLGLFK